MTMAKENDDETTVSFDQQALKLDNVDDAAVIVNAINKQKGKLKTLILSGNTLSIDAGKAIGDSLNSHKELTRALWSDMFTGRSKQIIAPALENLAAGVMLSGARLTELDLRDNAFGPTGVVGVTGLLGSSCCHSLKILRMDNEGLGHQGCKYVADALMKCLHDSQSEGRKLQLEVFTAGRNRLENEGAKMLSEVFFEMKSLRELALYQNGIGIHGPDGCEALARALSENKKLKILNLADNSLTSKGIKILGSKAFPHLENLEVLNVNDCILRSSGAQRLAECLIETTPNLKELHVSGNEIRRHAAIDLVCSLQNKVESLQVLDLNTNELGETGIADVQEAALSLDLESCLQSMSDDEGYDDDEEDAEVEEEDDDSDEDEDSLEGDQNVETTKTAANDFTFKVTDPTKGKSLFEGLSICSPNTGFGSMFPNAGAPGSKPTASLFDSPSKPAPASITGRSLFGNTTGSQEAQSLFKPASVSTANPLPSMGLFSNPVVSNGTSGTHGFFGSTGKGDKSGGSATIIQPGKLGGGGSPSKEDTKMIEDFLKVSSKPEVETVKRLSSVSLEAVKNFLDNNPSKIEAAVRRSVECLDVDGGCAIGKIFLNGSLVASPTEATNLLMVELGLIKGESRKNQNLPAKQAETLLFLMKDAYLNKRIPAREAKLLSFILSRGPERANAVELRRRCQTNIDDLIACIEKGVIGLKI